MKRSRESGDLARDWEAVGHFHMRAGSDVAKEVGGEDLATQVNAALEDPMMHGGIAFAAMLLNRRSPEAGERFLRRAEEVQALKYQEDIRRALTLRKPRPSAVVLSGDFPRPGLIARIRRRSRKLLVESYDIIPL